MNYAIVKIQGKQYLLKPGDRVRVNGIIGKPDEDISTGQALLVQDKQLQIGTPELDLPVTFKVVGQQKGKKITVATYKAKSRYRRVKGHRQMQTTLELLSVGKAKTTPPAKKKSAASKPAATKTTRSKTATKPSAKKPAESE